MREEDLLLPLFIQFSLDVHGKYDRMKPH